MHTHIPLAEGQHPNARFSGADRGVMLDVVAALEAGRHLLPALRRRPGPLRDRRIAPRHPAERAVLRRLRPAALAGALATALAAAATPAAGQTDSTGTRPQPAFRFSHEAGLGLRALWEQSVSAKQERVACLGASVQHDTVFVSRILALVPQEADSMSISAAASIQRCGPPEWAGTAHTHVAVYSDDLPSRHFSAQDRGVMRQWYEQWNSDGVFCVVYSQRDAHCEADGVVGGMRRGRVIVR